VRRLGEDHRQPRDTGFARGDDRGDGVSYDPVELVRLVKDDPSSGDVHVDTPLGSRDQKRKRKPPAELPDTEVKLAKLDEAQRLVYGVVLEPHAEDTQGDWETPGDVAQAAHRYLSKGWHEPGADVGVQHVLRAPKDAVSPVETFVAPV